uniref:Uncharacterized protein n=1 Tax=Salix viminalis TaxID=40686 RepID=A0A6N2NFN0_SALVM
MLLSFTTQSMCLDSSLDHPLVFLSKSCGDTVDDLFLGEAAALWIVIDVGNIMQRVLALKPLFVSKSYVMIKDKFT